MKLIRRDPDKGYLDDMLWIPKHLVNVDGVKSALEFELSDRNTIRCLRLWRESEHHLVVPRAFWKPADLPFECIDCRPAQYERTNITSRIHLDHKPGPGGVLQPTGKKIQRKAVEALLRATGGTLQLACGKGKTVVALHFAALLQVPVLIAVDNTHLLHQWMEEIERHLDVPGGVGLIQGDVKDWDKDVVMATYQTLANWAETMPEEVRRKFGLVVWDEGHHVSAPVFSKSAPLFYGYRLALTATPNRPDGSHVVCQYHVGDVIFKDVVQDHPPKIYFKWTDFSIDMDSSATRVGVCAKNGELHLGKLAGFFGASRERLTKVVLPVVRRLVDDGHKVIVLSYSVDEVINLMTLWTENNDSTRLYTEIPYPTGADVGEDIEPVELKKAYLTRITNTIREIQRNLRRNGHSLTAGNRVAFQERLERYQEELRQHEVWKKTERELRRRQKEFLQKLLKKPSTSGLFTEVVDPPTRMDMLAKRQVIFAIMKYGREGLDDKKLSAIVVCEPVSDRNTLQQIMGRPRDKKNSELVFLEDNVSPLIGQCIKLRRHLRNWPPEEGGPFHYTLVDHPSLRRRMGVTGIRVPGTGGNVGT